MKIDTEKLDFAICEKGMMLKDVAHASGLSEIASEILDRESRTKTKNYRKIASALGVNIPKTLSRKVKD